MAHLRENLSANQVNCDENAHSCHSLPTSLKKRLEQIQHEFAMREHSELCVATQGNYLKSGRQPD